MNACHTFEHQNINKNSNVEVLDKKNKYSRLTVEKPTNNIEMAPIAMPKQTETVQKLALRKQVKIPNTNEFSLEKFKNWNEEKLVKTLGKSHFVKEEGNALFKVTYYTPIHIIQAAAATPLKADAARSRHSRETCRRRSPSTVKRQRCWVILRSSMMTRKRHSQRATPTQPCVCPPPTPRLAPWRQLRRTF